MINMKKPRKQKWVFVHICSCMNAVHSCQAPNASASTWKEFFPRKHMSEQQTALSNRNSIQPVYMGLPNLFYFCQPLSVFVVTELLHIIQSSQVLQEAFNRCVAVLTHSSKPDDMSVQVSCSNFNLYQSSEKLCMYIF